MKQTYTTKNQRDLTEKEAECLTQIYWLQLKKTQQAFPNSILLSGALFDAPAEELGLPFEGYPGGFSKIELTSPCKYLEAMQNNFSPSSKISGNHKDLFESEG